VTNTTEQSPSPGARKVASIPSAQARAAPNRLSDAEQLIDFLRDLFERRGADAYLGEDVTMSQHMLQAAAFAERDGHDDAVVVAALLHDIGHFEDELTERFALEHDNRHQDHGARALEGLMPETVVACVRGHVAAKRYLCRVERDYFEQLSDASVHTLELQGGPMDKEQADAFASNPDLDAIVTVRRYDDAGKDANAVVPDFEHYVPRLRRLLLAA
jgi:phosphonate degradation associated HDIG domain protein